MQFSIYIKQISAQEMPENTNDNIVANVLLKKKRMSSHSKMPERRQHSNRTMDNI